MAAKVKKGDRVVVLAGKDKGREGEVMRVIPKEDRVVVQGVAMVKKHEKQSVRSQGGIVSKEAAIHVSNVAHIDPKDGKPTRVGFEVVEGKRYRVARRSGTRID
jgi:large subunit ribosomal protein L24